MMQSDAVSNDTRLMAPVPPTCLVLERHGTWAAALRRINGLRSWRLREARGFAEIDELLRVQDRSLVAVEVRVDGCGRTIAGIDRMLRDFPRVNCIALGNHLPATIAMLAWEAGAVAVINSPRQVARVATIVERWAIAMREHPAQQAIDAGSVRQIQARLPFRAVDPNRPLPPATRRRKTSEGDDEPINFEPLP